MSSSLKLIAGEIGKRRQFFCLLAQLKPYANNRRNFTQTSHRRGTILGNGTLGGEGIPLGGEPKGSNVAKKLILRPSPALRYFSRMLLPPRSRLWCTFAAIACAVNAMIFVVPTQSFEPVIAAPSAARGLSLMCHVYVWIFSLSQQDVRNDLFVLQQQKQHEKRGHLHCGGVYAAMYLLLLQVLNINIIS